jgi:hypothetical protein
MMVKPSLRFASMLLLFHAMAASVIFATAMPLTARLAMSMLVLLSLLYHLARDALLLSADSWREFSFDQGLVSIVTRDGSGYSGQLTNKTTVSTYFAVLSIRREGRSLPVFRVVFPDALDTGEFRELCVRLKFAQ